MNYNLEVPPSLPSLLCLWVAALLASPALAETRGPAAPAPIAHPLAASVEQVAAAQAKKLKREAPRLDPQLSQAAFELARVSPEEGLPVQSGIINDALALAGVVEPSPHLLMSTFSPGQEQQVLDGLSGALAEALGQGRWRRLGVGVSPPDGGRSRLVVLLLESFVDLQPMPRSAPLGPALVPVKGRLLPPYQKPHVLVTNPRGQVERLPTESGKESAFSAGFRCQLRGRYQIEVLGEDSHGDTVLANFPLHCGQEAPKGLLATREAAEPFRDARDAEGQLLALLNADRARFGLPALVWSEPLAAVGRAHSADMRAGNFVGHVSPKTGTPGDRVRRAGIDSLVLRENLARAYSPREAQRGLMDSPGHRANILDRAVTHVGIGVELHPLPGGVRELWVTQLLMKPPLPFDPKQAPVDALERVQGLRRKEGLGPLRADPELATLAAEVARAVGEGKLTPERVGEPVQQATGRFAGRYRVLRTVLALTSDVAQLASAPSLLDKQATHIGVGTAAARREQAGKAPGVYVVLVLGQGTPDRAK